jgi:hypothetical protein
MTAWTARLMLFVPVISDITLPDKFKAEYCRLWRSLFTLDTKSIEDIALKWGIQLPVDLFASAILLRPFQVDKRRQAAQKLAEEKPKSEYEQQVELKQKMRNMLANEALIPRVGSHAGYHVRPSLIDACRFLGVDLYHEKSTNVSGQQSGQYRSTIAFLTRQFLIFSLF